MVPKQINLHIFIINSLVCLSVCDAWPPKLLGRFQNFLAGNCIWVGDGYFFLEKFFSDQIFFSIFFDFFKNFKNFQIFNFFENFQIFIFFENFRKFSNSKKISCQKFSLRKKICEKKICSWASKASHVYLEYIVRQRHPLCKSNKILIATVTTTT